MPCTIIPQYIRERQLKKLANADGYTFIGWVDVYRNVHSRIRILCPSHGTWDVTVHSFASLSSRCKGCQAVNRSLNARTPQITREKQITELAASDGYMFVGWVNGYKNQNSKAVITCATHGDWSVSVTNFINSERRCPRCGIESNADLRRIPQHDREKQLTNAASSDGYSFVGWLTNYSGVDSRAIMVCPFHGEWSVSAVNFLFAGSRCPSCAVTGYQPSKYGTLYALLSDCGTMVKIGISNVLRDRCATLKRKTPFGFTVYRQLTCEDGSLPPILEREFHNAFPTAGLRGFDGATEWRLWHDDVNTWFDLLGG